MCNVSERVSVCVCLCVSICLSVCLSVCLCVRARGHPLTGAYACFSSFTTHHPFMQCTYYSPPPSPPLPPPVMLFADAVNRATASNEGHSPALEDPLSDSGEESLSEIPEYVTTITRQVRGQGQPKKVVDDVEPAVKQLSGQAKKSPVPPLPLNPTSRKPADSTEQDTSTVSNTSDTDCTLRQRRQTPLGESDHGSQSSPVKVTVTAQLGTATKEAIANPTLEELRSRREKIESEGEKFH